MNSLELKSAVKRLYEGECPRCSNKLTYISYIGTAGELEKNGMAATCNTVQESHIVFCKTCGYESDAVQIGLKIIPEDRICAFDTNWDKKYLEDNTLIYGEKGKNPFNIKDKE